jgi:Na+/glutamate symporter
MATRNAQLAIIVAAGLLLFIAGQWPTLTIPACLVMLVVIGIALRTMRSGSTSDKVHRNPWRRVGGIAIALALLLWALLSVRRG